MQSAIYKGRLRHRRFFPKYHEFCYSSTLFYIDLDELPELFSSTRFYSLNRFNLGCFLRKDYLGNAALPLIDEVRNTALRLAGYCPSGPVRMLTNLRIWGFCFNPVTFYYLFNQHQTVPELVLAEVNNTPWNERHVYVVRCNTSNGKTESFFSKDFHVSPFNPIDMTYRWVSTPPHEDILVHMENHRVSEDATTSVLHMDATLTLQRHSWSGALLGRILWLQPWTAIKVPLAIYWQALRLVIKGAPVYDHTKLITTGDKP